MSNRSWFFASAGKQQGPYPEDQFRDLIAQGVVRAETLVWTEGMAGWQKAGEIPGLLPVAGNPPAMPPSARVPAAGAGQVGALSIDLPLWEMLGRTVIFVIGMLLVIPAPWVATSFYRWLASRTRVPGRPNFGFVGQPLDIWYVVMGTALLSYAGVSKSSLVQLAAVLAQAFLAWMILRWIAANLTSNGERLPIAFEGSVWGYIGWYALMTISFITIIGWAWVIAFWMRWMCRNVAGTRREIVFNASGLQLLWRTLLFGIACAFLIPIPWALRWYTCWYVSQFALVPRGAYASA